MKTIILTFIFLVMSQVFVLAQSDCSNKPTGTYYANISVAQSLDTVNAYLNKNWFVILDVRTPAEYNSKHLQQAVNLDYYSSSFATDLASLDTSKLYLLHCASGSRSAQVYIQMQNLNFYRVYNMTGGINAWYSAGYATTTAVEPILGACQTDISFENTVIGNTDSTLITITNAANDILNITGISDLTGSVFSVDFDAEINLPGGRDYSFYVYYTPDDEIADDIIFSVSTNGGNVDYNLHGTAIDHSGVSGAENNNIVIYNDVYNQNIVVSGKSYQTGQTYFLYNSGGALISSGSSTDVQNINYAHLPESIYILKVISATESKTFKMALMH